MVRACLNQEIRKISNLIQVKYYENACPRPKLTEGRIYPKAEFHRMPNVPMFRSVD